MQTKFEVLQTIIKSWCETQDVEAVIAHLTEDVVWHYSTTAAAPKIGHDGAREFLKAYKLKARRPNWRIFRAAEAGNALFVEGADEFDTVEGGHVAVPYMGIFEFEGQRIKAWRDYFNPGLVAEGERGVSPPDYVRALLDRPVLPGSGSQPSPIQGVAS
ncbi:nuclear transport factor 2 family protein [Maricaulis sp.]|uniref:nuclear transport factor 2 family protein n=1 Tax=Maricaulis sp. TaxID=1486257 RepID=UPI003A8CDDEE